MTDGHRQGRRLSVTVDVSPLAGEFRIESKPLGVGNFGKVLLGTHALSGRKVAIKVIKKELFSKKLSLVQLEREIKLLSLVRHPHIARLYKVIPTDESLFLVMEYCPGGELFEYIIMQGTLKEAQSRMFFRQILSAVHYCHENHIVHRDLKLENMLLDDQHRIKVIDFGLAAAFRNDTLMKTFCGTPEYAAPELLMGLPYRGPAVDIWALGVILYAMVVGALPYGGDKHEDVVDTMKAKRPFIPEHLAGNPVVNLIDCMLAYVPDKRPTTTMIWQHPWVCEGPNGGLEAYVVPTRESVATLDEAVLTDLSELGFTREQVLAAVSGPVPEASLTASAYFLIAERKKIGDAEDDWLNARVKPGGGEGRTIESLRKARKESLRINSGTLEKLQVARVTAQAANPLGSNSSGSPTGSGIGAVPVASSAPAHMPPSARLPTPPMSPRTVVMGASPRPVPGHRVTTSGNYEAAAAAAAARWGGGTKGAAQYIASHSPAAKIVVGDKPRAFIKQQSETSAFRAVRGGTPHKQLRVRSRATDRMSDSSSLSDDDDFHRLVATHSPSPSIKIRDPAVPSGESPQHDTHASPSSLGEHFLPRIISTPASGSAAIAAAAAAAAKYAASQGARTRREPDSPTSPFVPSFASANLNRSFDIPPGGKKGEDSGSPDSKRFAESVPVISAVTGGKRRPSVAEVSGLEKRADTPTSPVSARTPDLSPPTPVAAKDSVSPPEKVKKSGEGTKMGITFFQKKKKGDLRVVKGPFSCTTTSSKRASEVMAELEKGMSLQNITYTLEGYTYTCVYDAPDEPVVFEVEVCLVDKVDLRGLKCRRARGNSWTYKTKLLQLLAVLNL